MLFEILWIAGAIAVIIAMVIISTVNWKYRAWQLREARAPRFVKNQRGKFFALCPEEDFARGIPNRHGLVKVPGKTMTFTDGYVNAGYVTGMVRDMEEITKGCKVRFESTLYIPFAFDNPNDIIAFRVLPEKVKRIVRSARPKLVRNFIRRHHLSVGDMMLAVALIAVVAMGLSFFLYRNHSKAVQVTGDRVYAVGYDTSYGYVPNGQTFEELRSDPAVWGIMYSEKTTDPNIELHYDYNCNQGFWRNRCGWASYGRRVRVGPRSLAK